MKVPVIIQARIGSTRLPGKVLRRIGDKTLLDLLISRLRKSKYIGDIIVATTTNKLDDNIQKHCYEQGVECFRGSEEDVLDRYYNVMMKLNASYFIRVTGDCPLIDPILVDNVVAFTIKKRLDYGSNVLEHKFPDGQDIEVISKKALIRTWTDARLTSDREHVTPFIINNSTYKQGNLFESDNYTIADDFGHVRLTVDEPEDFEVIRILVQKLGIDSSWREYADLYLLDDEINQLNCRINRNEGYAKSLKEESE